MASYHDQPVHDDEHEHDLGEHDEQPTVDDNATPPTKVSPMSPQILDLDLPQSDLDLTSTFEAILSEPQSRDEAPETVYLQKRASNVLKLTQQNEKLQAELRAMTARLEAAERKQQELAARAAREQAQARPDPSSS
ncbi:hypothetical protein FOMPIDRAFT_1013156 [Fomitopsis schrenkii]|uniref:Uncharacterized protein n=1 Tax=Fomitopsis schrenkii TaxID=2126942 RepID=S8G7W5_FOMSC|nr:hypothetical protein FOMPIDRAFT_1013156 [Fomitopsis schrenkii]